MYDRDPVIEIACFVVAIIFLFVFFYACATVDLGASAYDKVNMYLTDIPSVKPLVVEALSDGVLTQNELNDIKEYVNDESKRVVLSKIEVNQ